MYMNIKEAEIWVLSDGEIREDNYFIKSFVAFYFLCI